MTSSEPTLQRTGLHDWHVANGGKMVEFGGYDMPVQYATGIIAEHMATRRGAGLFDVSHMGRFRIRGERACEYLSIALTCNVAGLAAGEAAYGFIATHTGGAVDDAYVYMLDKGDYLLVVNAANRDKDWAWLQTLRIDGATLHDDSEQLGMMSLQGPSSQLIMESLISASALPANKRNQLSHCIIDGHEVIVARTGYTGEPVCFELFPLAEYCVELWQRLIDLGASAVGLGARDSLRLEAGLPLYGHELGIDANGNEIAVFCNDLARFAVRGGDGYIGCEPIARQREEYLRIKRNEHDATSQPTLLTHLVQPIAVFNGRRPLRAGYKVLLDGEPVGWVTSGTTVPYAPFDGDDIMATPGEQHILRPIGLAMIRSNIRFRSDRQVHFDIADDRGKAFAAELV